MNLKEATLLGKLFKRHSISSIDNRWIRALQYSYEFDDNQNVVIFAPEDILADDWEIKQ